MGLLHFLFDLFWCGVPGIRCCFRLVVRPSEAQCGWAVSGRPLALPCSALDSLIHHTLARVIDNDHHAVRDAHVHSLARSLTHSLTHSILAW